MNERNDKIQTTSNEPPEVKYRGRHERTTRSVAELLQSQELPVLTPVTAAPSATSRDITVMQNIRMATEHGVVFQKEETTTLVGVLDPANRGHLAKALEEHFASMCRLAVQAFNQVLDEANPEPPPKPRRGHLPMAASSSEAPQSGITIDTDGF